MIIDGVKITTDFKADKEELAAYVQFVKEHVQEVSSVEVNLCNDSAVDLNWKRVMSLLNVSEELRSTLQGI